MTTTSVQSTAFDLSAGSRKLMMQNRIRQGAEKEQIVELERRTLARQPQTFRSQTVASRNRLRKVCLRRSGVLVIPAVFEQPLGACALFSSTIFLLVVLVVSVRSHVRTRFELRCPLQLTVVCWQPSHFKPYPAIVAPCCDDLLL